MKSILLLIAGTALVGAAQAADVGVSVQVGQPGFYGRIDIGNAAPPPVVVAEPIWVQRAEVRPQPIYLRVPPGHQKHWDKHCREYRACGVPVYLRVPPGHQKHWDKHCREYNACGVPVYFVREDWYQDHYKHHDQDEAGDDGKGHGKGHGKDHDKKKIRD